MPRAKGANVPGLGLACLGLTCLDVPRSPGADVCRQIAFHAAGDQMWTLGMRHVVTHRQPAVRRLLLGATRLPQVASGNL